MSRSIQTLEQTSTLARRAGRPKANAGGRLNETRKT